MEGPRAPISAGCEEEAGRREERAKEADLAERRSTYDDERRKELQEWREQETVHQWMQKARDLQDSDAFTVADICSGGLLASMASTRAGLKHVFTSEIDPVMKNGRRVTQATIAFGITCLIIILVLDTPKALAAKIYSKFLTLRNSARTTPTNPVQLKRTTISVSNQKFIGKIAAKIIMTYKYGKDVQISINL